MNRWELARVMRSGIQREEIIESQDCYIDVDLDYCRACALGAATVETFDGDYFAASDAFHFRQEASKGAKFGYDIFAEILEISPQLACSISLRHETGQSIEQIAQWLESDPDWAEGWEDNAHV